MTKTNEVSENTPVAELTMKDVVARAALGALVGIAVNVVATAVIEKTKARLQARKLAKVEVSTTK